MRYSRFGAFVCAVALAACSGENEVCNDGQDNDSNGQTDCADSACGAGTLCGPNGVVCSADQTCSTCSGNGGAVQSGRETSCADGFDNDCDGSVDCIDTDCATASSCDQSGTIGGDPNSNYVVAVTAGRTRLPADGQATTDIVATYRKGSAPIAGGSCTFSVAPGGPLLDGTPGPVTKVTQADGVARVTFRSTTAAGTYQVNVACSSPLTSSNVSAALSIELPLLHSLRVASVQYPVMGARFEGFREQGAIVFEALDAAGRPYPAGLAVTFTHPSQGGSYIGPWEACSSGLPPTCSAEARTDEEGRATVFLTAGRRYALLSVRANAMAGGPPLSAIADDIAVVGVKPNGAHIGVDCRPWNVPAFTEHDCMVSHYRGEGTDVNCVLTLADRHGIVVGFPTLGAFWSEAGMASQPVLTLPYDPAASPADQLELGRAVGYVSVLGQPLPWDVDDLFPGEPSRYGDFGCEPRIANPRDGLVTVIALVAGEEGFVDQNGNGQFDEGEPFVDIGEPFVDANDDGEWQVGEPFQDVNEDFTYTGPNGTWDADTVLWTQTRIVYTGHPGIDSRLYDYGFGPPPLPTPPATPFTDDRSYGVYFADENFNPLSGLAKYDASTAVGNATAKLPFVPGTADPVGVVFRELYCQSPDGAGCVYGPAASACTTSPCYVVPGVSGFMLGTYLELGVNCTQEGPDRAFVSVSLNGVRTVLWVDGTCPPPPPPPTP